MCANVSDKFKLKARREAHNLDKNWDNNAAGESEWIRHVSLMAVKIHSSNRKLMLSSLF